VREAIRDAVAAVERDWEQQLGAARFAQFKRMLQELSEPLLPRR